MQKTIDFVRAERLPVLVRYSADERRFFAMTPILKLPQSFLLESRSQRIGCSVAEMRAMRSYDLARELADETAILGSGPLDSTCRMQPTRLCDAVVDAAAKRMAADRAEQWQEYLKTTFDAGRMAKGGA